MRLEVAPGVEVDLRRISRYIAQDKPGAASAFVERVIDEFEAIARTPLLFGSAAGLRTGFRRALVGRYHIVYRVIDDTVRIERVIHAMRDLPHHLG